MLKFNTIPPIPGSVELTEFAKDEAVKSAKSGLMCWEARTMGRLAADSVIAQGAKIEDAAQIGTELAGQISAVYTSWDYSLRASEAFGRGFQAQTEVEGAAV